ncbi:hypothetical protein ACFLZN_01670 [Nanoarchaeota archaeon]
MKYLFVEEDLIKQELYTEFEESKQRRIDVQYYIKKNLDEFDVDSDVRTAKIFLLEIEQIIENITQKQIERMRDKVKSI